MHTASPRHHARTLLPCPNGCTDYTTDPGRAHCIATPPRPNTTAVSERVHRLHYWPWTSTAEHDHHSKVDVPGTYCHATAPEHYCRVRTGAPTKLLALGAHIASPRHHARTLLPCPNGCTDYTTGPGRARPSTTTTPKWTYRARTVTPPRPTATTAAGRVHRLIHRRLSLPLTPNPLPRPRLTCPQTFFRIRAGLEVGLGSII